MPEASEGLYYLNLDDVLGLYCEVFGCPLEVATERLRSLQGLESALARPETYAHYENAGIARQAASLAHGIAEGQPFIEGNRRIALVSMLTFLRVNGYDVSATQEARANWMLGLAEDSSLGDLAAAIDAALLRTSGVEPNSESAVGSITIRRTDPGWEEAWQFLQEIGATTESARAVVVYWPSGRAGSPGEEFLVGPPDAVRHRARDLWRDWLSSPSGASDLTRVPLDGPLAISHVLRGGRRCRYDQIWATDEVRLQEMRYDFSCSDHALVTAAGPRSSASRTPACAGVRDGVVGLCPRRAHKCGGSHGSLGRRSRLPCAGAHSTGRAEG